MSHGVAPTSAPAAAIPLFVRRSKKFPCQGPPYRVGRLKGIVSYAARQTMFLQLPSN